MSDFPSAISSHHNLFWNEKSLCIKDYSLFFQLIPSQTGPCGTKQSSVLSEPPTHGSFPHSRAENETPSPGPCSLPPGVPVETPLDLSKNKFVFSGNQNSRTFISGKPIDLSIKPSNASSELPSDCSTPCSQTNSPKVSRTSDAEISSSVISSSSNLPVLLDAGSKQVSPVRPIVEATSDFFGQMKKKFSHFSLSSTSLHQLGEDSTVSVSSSVSPIDPSSLDECQYRLLGKACGCAKCTFSKFQKTATTQSWTFLTLLSQIRTVLVTTYFGLTSSITLRVCLQCKTSLVKVS